MLPFASSVYDNKILFGGYPNKDWFDILVDNNIKIFVDLTSETEKINCNLYDYKKDAHDRKDLLFLNCSIPDNDIPENINEFKDFIKSLIERILTLKYEEKIYIHCKGGHSRSGMFVASLLCFLCNITPEKSLYITTVAHANRENLRSKWRHQKCPQLFRQRKFVIDVFKPIIITPLLFQNKISNNLSSFLNETNIRPLREKKDNHLLCDVLIHLRNLLFISPNPSQVMINCSA